MVDFKFILDSNASNGTSNLSGILRPEQSEALRKFTPGMFEEVFGPGVDIDMPSKGYTDPEWYWKSSDGCVLGIGWRWGVARLRGRGVKGASCSMDERASEFVNFLASELKNDA